MAGLSSHTRPESNGLDSGTGCGCTPVWSTMHTGKTSHHHTHSGHLPPLSRKTLCNMYRAFKTIKWMSTATLEYVIIWFHRRLRIGKLYYSIISDKGTDNNQRVVPWSFMHRVDMSYTKSMRPEMSRCIRVRQGQIVKLALAQESMYTNKVCKYSPSFQFAFCWWLENGL